MPNNMSMGEQMVWAAAYVAALNDGLKNRPSNTWGGNYAEYDAWRHHAAIMAVEAATEAVLNLRAIERRVAEENCSEASPMYNAIRDLSPITRGPC